MLPKLIHVCARICVDYRHMTIDICGARIRVEESCNYYGQSLAALFVKVFVHVGDSFLEPWILLLRHQQACLWVFHKVAINDLRLHLTLVASLFARLTTHTHIKYENTYVHPTKGIQTHMC